MQKFIWCAKFNCLFSAIIVYSIKNDSYNSVCVYMYYNTALSNQNVPVSTFATFVAIQSLLPPQFYDMKTAFY